MKDTPASMNGGWACLFLGPLLAFRLWHRHESALNWSSRFIAQVGDLLSWSDALPRVGPVLSQRIVRFREVLGGFDDIDNLYEVYGLDSSVVDGAKSFVTVDATLVHPMYLDTVPLTVVAQAPSFRC